MTTGRSCHQRLHLPSFNCVTSCNKLGGDVQASSEDGKWFNEMQKDRSAHAYTPRCVCSVNAFMPFTSIFVHEREKKVLTVQRREAFRESWRSCALRDRATAPGTFQLYIIFKNTRQPKSSPCYRAAETNTLCLDKLRWDGCRDGHSTRSFLLELKGVRSPVC